ncbi:MAG: rod shape-determining protein RodA [Ignavibacteriales bacterium]|nr:rod shape-determining protein RodA [Ignavibacteriales bacterium]
MNSFFKEYFDRTVFLTCIALVIIGIFAIYSATYDAHAGSSFHKQILWASVGFVLMIVVTFLPLRFLQRSSYIAYFASLMVLAAVLAVGRKVYGSQSWFGVAGMGVQPSEFVKITTLLALAQFLGNPDVNLGRVKDLATTFGIVMLPVTLIMMQPDFGTSLTFFGMLIPVLYWAGASNFLILAIVTPPLVALSAIIGTTAFIAVLILVAVVLYLARENRFLAVTVFGLNIVVGIFVQMMYEKLPLYQQKRITTFLDPNNDPLGAGYNVIQAKVAIGSGGVFGKGFLQGTQTQLNFIPKQWTDFIFCVPGEEFGFVGAMVVLGLFAVLLTRGIRLGYSVKNRFGSVIAIGISALFAFHMFVNVGMCLGLMPVIGIPLPFLSYGGSSLVSYMIMAGLLMNVYANRKEY